MFRHNLDECGSIFKILRSEDSQGISNAKRQRIPSYMLCVAKFSEN